MSSSPSSSRFASLMAPHDAVPHEAALDRLVRARVVSDEQLMDYELNQALRGLCLAVKHATPSYPSPFQARRHLSSNSEGAASTVYGREAVLFRMCLLSATSPGTLPTLVYLSTRLLCDAATAYGEGNERPCCTAEWGHCLAGAWDPTAGCVAASDEWAGAPLQTSAELRAQLQVDRRFQLGYLRVVAGTLRSVAGGTVGTGRHLFADFVPFVDAVMSHVLPFAAMVAEGKSDAIASAGALPTAKKETDTSLSPAPSRLTCEANQFIIQCTYWLCVDILDVHLEKGTTTTKAKKAIRIQDRAAPQRLWAHVPRLRAALHRSFVWLEAEMVSHMKQFLLQQQQRQQQRQQQTDGASEGGDGDASGDGRQVTDAGDVAQRNRKPRPVSALTTSLIHVDTHVALSFGRATRGHVVSVLTDMLTAQEQLDYARRAAIQRFGESARDVHKITDAMWGETLRLCILLQSLTGAWVSVQGGLGLGETTTGIVLQSNRDVLVFVASCLSRLPSGGDGSPSVAAAVDALLAAAVTVSAAAPLSLMQRELWSAEGGAITREIHAALTQRGLRFKERRVLELTSLLMNSIMGTAAGSTGMASEGDVPAALLASETADQLLGMLAESRDAASHVAIGLLMNAVAQRPHAVVPALFRLLKSGSKDARANALDVLSGLPQALHAGAANGDLTTTTHRYGPVAVGENKLREILRMLAEQLLLHLQDDELVTRMQSAALFSKVWPEDVMYPLLNLSLQRDPRGVKQSAATSALTSVLTAHSADAGVVLLLLQESFQLLRSSSTKPPSSAASSCHTTGAEGAPRVEGGSRSTSAPTNTTTTALARAAPANPGEILTRSLLYAPTGMAADGEGDSPATAAAAAANGSPVKEERLHSAVDALCTVWSKAAGALAETTTCVAPCATAAVAVGVSARRHVEPLLTHVASLEDEAAQQFYVRHVTALLATLTARAQSHEEASSPSALTPAQVAVVGGLHNVFFFPPGGEASAGGGVDACPWLHEIAAAVDTRGQDTPALVLYRILIPLLCLRSCDRSCFANLSSLPDDDSGALQCRSHPATRIFECIWAALLTEPYMAFFNRHPSDMQRVLLEAACKAPPRVLLERVSARQNPLQGTHDLLQPDRLFRARVSVFAMCNHLSTLPWKKNDATPNKSETGQCLAHYGEVIHSLWPAVFGREGSNDHPPSFGASPQGRSALVLQQGLLDATALVSLGALYTSDTPAWESMQDVLTVGFAAAESEGKVGHAALVPEIHEHALRIIQAHQKGADLLVLWFTHFPRPLVALANAACKHEAKPCPTAVKCGEILFRAIMLSSKMDSSTRSRSSSPQAAAVVPGLDSAHGAAAAGEPPSFFMRHTAAVDCEALVSFGIGCARCTYGVPLQQVGVRILAALLGAALDRLLTTEPSPLSTIFSVLENIALIHEDASTRQLAEQVFQSMPTLTPRS